MPIPYPMQPIGRYKLGLAMTYKLLHEQFGFDFGERYHRDVEHRVETTMAIDRAVFEAYGRIGLGFEQPFPRASIEPFGHRFMPAMYGAETGYAADADPWGKVRAMSGDEILSLPPWTVERFLAAEPVRCVLDQVNQVRRRWDEFRKPADEFNPHYRQLSALQNLGSVVNTAFSVLGQELFLYYVTEPDWVHAMYANIAQLTLLCLEQFPRVDGWPLADLFVGNCTVAMVSPAQYAVFHERHDRALMDYARRIGARFMMHQDSDVNPHIAGYARLEYLHSLDVGQDTDFERLAAAFPRAEVNCILFPGWIESHTAEEIDAELRRLMQLGKRFPAFTFTMLEVDERLSGDALFAFHETFRHAALDCSASD